MRQTPNGNSLGPNMPHQEKGISIIEILVVIALITIGLMALLTLATFSLNSASVARETLKANALAQETMEAVRSYRDNNPWNNDDPGNQYDGLGVVQTGVAYYMLQSGGSPIRWQAVLGQESAGIFTRKVVFDKVSRNGSDDIESIYNPVNDDPDTKKVTVTVSWKSRKIEIATYLTNWRQ